MPPEDNKGDTEVWTVSLIEDIFGVSDKTDTIPPLQEVLALRGEKSTHQRAFERFHRTNPFVLDLLVRLTWEVVDKWGWTQEKGRRGGSINMFFEHLRWIYFVQTRGEEYRLSNNHRAFYARTIMKLCPELKGFFEIKKQKAFFNPDWKGMGIDTTDPRWKQLGRGKDKSLM